MSMAAEVQKQVTAIEGKFAPNALLLFVMGLKLRTDDYEELKRDYLLDGPDDKKLDFCSVDLESGRVIVAQGFEGSDWAGQGIPSNKAADLNTANAWLLDADVGSIPRESVRARAQEVRDALERGSVSTFEAYYVHRGARSPNVDAELATVQRTLSNRLREWEAKTGRPISVIVEQLDLNAVGALYQSRYASIAVTERVSIATEGRFQEITRSNWKALYGTALAQDLVELANKYGDKFTSANLREYLGEREYSRNINRKIAETASKTPESFWVFNNGVTFITRRGEASADSITCDGLAVINGAQTLGSLQTAAKSGPVTAVRVFIRVIESSDQNLVEDIIRYNNTQNPIKPWELRVLDPVQERIAREFSQQFGITYQLRRKQGRRGTQDVLFEKLGLWLNSFYGQPTTSHRNSSEVFDNDSTYITLFNNSSSVRHLLFVYRLGEAIGAVKDAYRTACEGKAASDTDQKLYGYFRFGAFTHVVLHLCAELLEELFGGGAATKKRLCLSQDLERNREQALGQLEKLVKYVLAPIPFALQGLDEYQQFRSTEGIKRMADALHISVRQFRSINQASEELLKTGIVVV